MLYYHKKFVNFPINDADEDYRKNVLENNRDDGVTEKIFCYKQQSMVTVLKM